MILRFIKIALSVFEMTALKLETNFASFPEVGHDGAKDFAAEVCRNFLNNRLELRDHHGLLPEDLSVHVPPEVVVINPDCKGAMDSPPALRSPFHESLPPRMPYFQCSGVRRRPVVTTTDLHPSSKGSALSRQPGRPST